MALRSTRHREFAEFRDLKTGQTIKRIGGGQKPEGTPLELRAVWSGNKSRVDEPVARLITSPEEWSNVRTRMFRGLEVQVPSADDVDFTKESLILISMGKTTNCDGISYVDAFQGPVHISIRLRHHWYQSMGETPPTWPYGIFVVPRSTTHEYVLYRNTQGLIGGPPIWKAWERLQRKQV
ncbi:MAG: hypothetical protein AB1486_14230 [Planctomycetota bacterium]